MNFPMPEREQFSKDYWVIPSQQRFGAENSILVFSTTVKIKHLLKGNDVKLVSDFDRKHNWELHRIIQRNITSSRVTAIKNNYLENRQKSVKFFPAVTVALLPLYEGIPGDVYHDGEGFLGHSGIDLRDPQGNAFSGNIPDDSEHWNFPARLRWDLSSIVAVVIDGQHRIEALRRFAHEGGKVGAESESLPVSFLLYSPKTSPIEATRQVFIDVNNTPRRVSEQKLIFIDDNHLPRRLTATLLGSKVEADSEDPYVNINARGYLSNDDFRAFFNRYLVGEEESDDASLNLGFTRTHEDLLPWEITHIMTIHEVILQRIILPYSQNRFAGNAANIKRIAQIINSALTYNILDEMGTEESIQRLVEMKPQVEGDKSLNSAEIRLFKDLIEWRIEFLEEKTQAKANGDEGDLEAEMTERFESFCISAPALERTVGDNVTLIKGNLGRINEFIFETFSSLWFVDKLIRSLTDNEFLSPELKLQIIHESRDVPWRKKRLLTAHGDSDGFVEELGDRLALGNDEKKEVKGWLIGLRRLTAGNLLCSQVGQQALFVWLRRCDAVYNNTLVDVLSELHERVNFINELGSSDLLTNSNEFYLDLGKFSLKGSLFEGTIVHGGVMRPGWDNAKKAATVLQVIYTQIASRGDVEDDPVIDQNDYKTTLGNIGSSLLRQSDDLDVNFEERSAAILEFLNTSACEKFLLPRDSNILRDATVESILEDKRSVRVARLALGGLFLESVMEGIYG